MTPTEQTLPNYLTLEESIQLANQVEFVTRSSGNDLRDTNLGRVIYTSYNPKGIETYKVVIHRFTDISHHEGNPEDRAKYTIEVYCGDELVSNPLDALQPAENIIPELGIIPKREGYDLENRNSLLVPVYARFQKLYTKRISRMANSLRERLTSDD